MKDWRPNALKKTTGYYLETARVQWAELAWEFFTADPRSKQQEARRKAKAKARTVYRKQAADIFRGWDHQMRQIYGHGLAAYTGHPQDYTMGPFGL